MNTSSARAAGLGWTCAEYAVDDVYPLRFEQVPKIPKGNAGAMAEMPPRSYEVRTLFPL